LSVPETGLVSLIGAGPGDPSLLTVRGHQCLVNADVVVYDHRIDQRLLNLIGADAETFAVGQRSQNATDESAVCLLLAEKARAGKKVARLKLGDPFIFGSGSKEALFLHEQGLEFEIVPGVPSSIGSAAYAGIPASQPETGSILTVVQGHEPDSEELSQNALEHLAKLEGTIVSYGTGVQLSTLATALQRHGRPSTEPTVLIYHGTKPAQYTIETTLSEIADFISRSDQSETAVIVIGQATTQRQHLRWYDVRPLFGVRIVVTRARAQAAELVNCLKDLGADPIEVPTIQILPPADPTPLDDVCTRLESFDWVVLTSTNAVSYFMSHLLAGSGDVRNLKDIKLCAVGPATAESLSQYGLKIDLIPDEHNNDGVIRALRKGWNLKGSRILLPRADLAGDELPSKLRNSSAEVTTVTAYRTAEVDFTASGTPDIDRLFHERQVDIVTFTSGSSVRNFVKAIGPDKAVELLNHVAVACIGPATAKAANDLGLTTSIVPANYTIPALVRAIVQHAVEHRNQISTQNQSPFISDLTGKDRPK